jgi:hypothetical protein
MKSNPESKTLNPSILGHLSLTLVIGAHILYKL